MKTIGITGITGLLGAHLSVAFLLRGFKVAGLVRNNSSKALLSQCLSEHHFGISDIQFIEGDMDNTESLEQLVEVSDVLIHAAALVSFWKKDSEKLYETNVQGTRNLVNALLLKPDKKLLYISSIAALGRSEGNNNLPIKLDNPWTESPYNTEYAESKHLAELEIWRGKEEGLQVAAVLPGVILGAGEGNKSSSTILSMARKGNKYYPTGSNGFVLIEDVVGLVLGVVEKDAWGRRYLAVTANRSYKQMMDVLAVAFQKKLPNTPLRGILFASAKAICRLLEYMHLPGPAPFQALRSTAFHSVYALENYPDLYAAPTQSFEERLTAICEAYLSRNK